MMKLFSKSTLRLFDWFLIIGIIILNILYSVVENNFDTLGSIASITGVVCVVLVAKRSMSNYLFGIINVSLYAYISYESSLYGDFLLN
ncbi:MAG: nicotinamide riboside transporter PnuC, partial [Bacteroidales bacterium]